MKYWFQVAISAALLQLSASAHADDRTLLRERLVGLATYAADFTQEIQGARGELLERSTGYVRLVRPMFKWVVDDPYPQVILSAGDVLKIYDPDLEQLTIRPLDEALENTPLALLTREDVVLGEQFEVARVVTTEEVRFLLTPRADDALYAEIELSFADDTLRGLSILDHLGQQTAVRFYPAAADPVIDSQEFELQVPPGTDVVGG